MALKLLSLLVFFLSTTAFGETKDWTLFVLMNGDNNLCSYAHKDMAELKSLNVSDKANIIVAFDCSAMNDSRLIELQGSKEIDLLTGKREFDMGDSVFFQNTAMQVFEKYPSTKRMAIIWNHGSGWNRLGDGPAIQGISYDDQSGNHITTKQLGDALKVISATYPLDIMGFDACLMQMAEISYEFADYAAYTVGSEDLEPGDGWDYQGVVRSLATSPAPEDLGRAIVDSYAASYPSDDVTLSLISNQKLKDLSQELKRLVPYLKSVIGMKTIVSQVPGWNGSFKDLGLFLGKLKEVDTAKRLYLETVVYSKANQPSTGLSIYLTPTPSTAYMGLKFSVDTGWYDFLRNMK